MCVFALGNVMKKAFKLTTLTPFVLGSIQDDVGEEAVLWSHAACKFCLIKQTICNKSRQQQVCQ